MTRADGLALLRHRDWNRNVPSEFMTRHRNLRRAKMKRIVMLAVAATGVALAFPAPAEAKGCIKGAIVGGLAGHFLGHHGAVGAAAGCAIGHHEANKRTQRSNVSNTAIRSNSNR